MVRLPNQQANLQPDRLYSYPNLPPPPTQEHSEELQILRQHRLP